MILQGDVTDTWYRTDDTIVTACDETEALTQKNAYLLIYENTKIKSFEKKKENSISINSSPKRNFQNSNNSNLTTMSTSPFSPPLTLPLNAFNLSSSLSDTQNNSTKSNISFFPAENLRKKEMEIDGVKPIIENRNIFRALSKNVRSTYSTRRRVGSIFRDVPDNNINNIRLTKNDSIRDLDFGGDVPALHKLVVSLRAGTAE